MKDYLWDIRTHFKGREAVIIIMMAGLFLCAYYASSGNFPFAIGVCACPILLIALGCFIHRPVLLFAILFIFNYGIMGITRYIYFPLPISVVMDGLLLLVATFLGISLIRGKTCWKSEVTPFLLLYGSWLVFCLIQLFNNTTGVGLSPAPWLRDVRPMAFDAVLIIIIFALLFNKYKDIKILLYAWGICILLAAAKGYWQRNHGFDSAEWGWLMSVGGRTHLIRSGIRYFSFFTDAANFGSNMAFSLVTYAICFLYERNKIAKIYFLIVAIAGGYGMMISGTRTALIVALSGFLLYTLLSKNIKLFLISFCFLTVSVGVLKYTTIGESNRLVSRMRTAFNPEDESLQVRLNNQKAIKSYMKEAPWGIGMGWGMGEYQLPGNNKYWIVSVTAPDSTLVYLWMRTGVIGITIFLFVSVLTIIVNAFIIFFRIRNPELRGVLTAFTCGSACMLVAGYGNFIYHQFPNLLLIYGLQTLVFMGPYFDKQLEMKKKDNDTAPLNTPQA